MLHLHHTVVSYEGQEQNLPGKPSQDETRGQKAERGLVFYASLSSQELRRVFSLMCSFQALPPKGAAYLSTQAGDPGATNMGTSREKHI